MPLAHKKEREIVCRFLIDILRITHEAYAPAKEPFGSRIETFYIGFCVAIGHADGRPFSISKIASYMCIPRTTVMRRLKRLQEWKLIEKRGHQYLMCVPTFMPSTGATQFECPNCGTRYKLVRVETDEVLPDQQLTCLKCGGPLHGREGKFMLKYFLVDRPGRKPLGQRVR
jgi:predicted RNA-binding Zn-ribbon protein involved in translation (DUF1610 family)